jgi:hypothetical protein
MFMFTGSFVLKRAQQEAALVSAVGRLSLVV